MPFVSMIYALASIAYLVMGVETYRSERRQKANILFFMSCAALSLWAFFVSMVMISESVEHALVFRQMAVVFWSFTYALYLHFIILLTMSDGGARRKVNGYRAFLKMLVLYAPALFSIYLYDFKEPSTIEEMVRLPYGWAYLNIPRNFLWDNYFLIMYLSYIATSIVALIMWRKRTTLQRVRSMVRMIVASTVAAIFVGTITDFLLPLTTENLLPPLGVLVSLIPVIGVRAATSRYRMLQLNPFGTARDILQSMKEGLLLVNLNNVIVEVNQEAGNLLAYTVDELIGSPCHQLIEGCDKRKITLINGSSEQEMVKKGGETLPVMLTSETLRDKWGDLIGTLFLFHDLTEFKRIHAELKKSHDLLERRISERTSRLATINQNLENEIVKRIQMEEKIRVITYKDQLTGLANRRLFTDRLEKAIFDAENAGHKLAIYSLNIDAFKMVNDTFGHLQGDSLLLAIAERMKTVYGSHTTVARNEADDFLIFRKYSSDSVSLFGDVDKVRSVFQKPFVLNGKELYITSTIGISIYPDDGDIADSLIKNAEIAMDAAIGIGYDQFDFFKPELKKAMSEEMELANDLYKAIEQNQFELYYQPQETNGRQRLEAWKPSSGGIIPNGGYCCQVCSLRLQKRTI